MADVSLVRNAALMLADHTLNRAIFLGNIKGENDHIRPKLMKQSFWKIKGENGHIVPHIMEQYFWKI